MVMTCPKCGGCGKITIDPSYGGQSTSVAPYTTVCNSCGGTGYVTDGIAQPPYPVRCVKCGKDMFIA